VKSIARNACGILTPVNSKTPLWCSEQQLGRMRIEYTVADAENVIVQSETVRKVVSSLY
jgi:hypothetical protein